MPKAEFKREMPCNLLCISISQPRSCIISSLIAVSFKLEIINSPFGISSNEMSRQAVPPLPVAQPATTFNASRKQLIAKLPATIEPPRTFILGIDRPASVQWYFHLYIRCQCLRSYSRLFFSASTVLCSIITGVSIFPSSGTTG